MTTSSQTMRRAIIHDHSPPWTLLGGSVSRVAFWGLSLSPAILTILGIVIPELSAQLATSYYSFFELIFIFGVYIQHGRNNGMMSGIPSYAIIGAIIFGLWSVITSATGPHPFLSLDKTAQWIILMGFLLAMTTKGRLEKPWFSDATQILAIGFIIYTGYMFAWFTTITDLKSYNWVNTIPGLWNIRQFAYYVACIYAISLTMLVAHDSKTGHGKRIITLFLMSLSASLLFWSGSRGASVSIAIAIAVLLYHANSKRVYFSAIIFLSILIGVLFSQLLPSSDQAMGVNRILHLGLNNPSQNYDFLSGRAILWSETWSAITIHPWSGYGPGIMPLLIADETSYHNHPHNLFLQFWLNWGAPGLIFALLSFLLLVKVILIRKFSLTAPFKPVYVGGLAGISYLVADGMIDGTLFYSQPLMFGSFFVSLMAAKKNSATFSASPVWSLGNIKPAIKYRLQREGGGGISRAQGGAQQAVATGTVAPACVAAASLGFSVIRCQVNTLGKGIARSVFLAAVVYFLLSSLAIASFYSDRPKEADDIRARIVRVFPVQTVLIGSDLRYASWLTEWYKGADKVPNEEWEWLASHCRGHRCSLLYQAMILQNKGQQQSALVLFDKVSTSNSPPHSDYARLQVAVSAPLSRQPDRHL